MNIMPTEQNKATVLRNFEEVFNKGNLTLLDEMIAPNWVIYGPSGQEIEGKESYRHTVTTLRNAFPDLYLRIENIVAEGDVVAFRYNMQGTFKGKLGKITPTGKQFTISSAIFMRFKDGKAVEAREIYDQLTLNQQLGINFTKD